MMVTPSMFMRATTPTALHDTIDAPSATKPLAAVDQSLPASTEPARNGATKPTAVHHRKKSTRSFENPFQFDAIESPPMSKMNILTSPAPYHHVTGRSAPDAPLSAHVAHLAFPTPERLLPIGQPAKEAAVADGASCGALIERVREALDLPDLVADTAEPAPLPAAPAPTIGPRNSSPRRLCKQLALDSPPNSSHQLLDVNSSVVRSVTHEFRPDPARAAARPSMAGLNVGGPLVDEVATRQQRLRKVGPFAVDSQSIPDSRIMFAGSWPPPPRSNGDDSDDADGLDDGGAADLAAAATDADADSFVANGAAASAATAATATGAAAARDGRPADEAEPLCERCSDCGSPAEEYNDEEIGLMVIILATFIHREPSLAAPFLPEILATVSTFAVHCTFAWQFAKATHLPGGSQSVAHQFLRCVLHQLAPNGIFGQMFLTQGADRQRQKYFRSVAKALVDFPELNPASPVHMLVDTLNQKKTLPLDTLNTTLRNMGEYLQCVPLDVGIGTNTWSLVVQGIETLFRRLVLHLKDLVRPDYLLDIMVCVLRVPGVSKAVLEPFSKVLSHCVQSTPLRHRVLVDLCTLSGRVFSKERDKHQLCRQLVFELVQVGGSHLFKGVKPV